MTLVKICGLRDIEAAAAAVAGGVDMIGMVFAASRRQVTPETCEAIVSAVHQRRRQPGPAEFAGPAMGEVSERTWFHAWSEAIEDAIARYRPLTVGVFADQSLDDVNDMAEAAQLDLVQLSGGESTEFARQVRRPVVLVEHVSPGADPDAVLGDARPGPVALLLDTAVAGLRGGSGATFDWEIAAAAGRRQPLLLAGGLDPDNVTEAISAAHPWGVDVSTGVETGGAKDSKKIFAFITAAKGGPRDAGPAPDTVR